MNPFLVIILVAIILEYALQQFANLLNLKALKLELPPALAEVYKAEEYGDSQEYTRSSTRFDLVTSAFGLIVLLSFWFAGGFNFLDQVIRGWRFVPVVNGLLYIGILMSAYSVLMLPFSIYATFVIEERFGFNRTTPGTFVLDRVKGLALVVMLGAPLLAGVLIFFQYAGAYAWVYCWIIATVFMLMIQVVAPTWIMPLFNKFTPMESGQLKEAIINYANSVNFPIQNIFVMDGSKRSTKSNDFFTA